MIFKISHVILLKQCGPSHILTVNLYFPCLWTLLPLDLWQLELLLALLFTSPLGYSLNLEARAFIKGFKETTENFFVSKTMGSQRVGHNWVTHTHTHTPHYTHMHPTHHTHTHTHPIVKDNNTGEEWRQRKQWLWPTHCSGPSPSLRYLSNILNYLHLMFELLFVKNKNVWNQRITLRNF